MMKKKLAFVLVGMLGSALILVGNAVAETGTCARAAPCSDTQLYIYAVVSIVDKERRK